MAAYQKTFSDRTIRIYSGLPTTMASEAPSEKLAQRSPTGTVTTKKKEGSQADIRFIKGLFPPDAHSWHPKMAHAELVMVHPGEILPVCGKKFLTLQAEKV